MIKSNYFCPRKRKPPQIDSLASLSVVSRPWSIKESRAPAVRTAENGKSKYVHGKDSSKRPASPPLNPILVSPLSSAMRPSQPAPNVSTPNGNVLATSPASTSSYVTKPKRSAGESNVGNRNSNRVKGQSFPPRRSLHLQRSPRQRHGPLSILGKTLPVS